MLVALPISYGWKLKSAIAKIGKKTEVLPIAPKTFPLCVISRNVITLHRHLPVLEDVPKIFAKSVCSISASIVNLKGSKRYRSMWDECEKLPEIAKNCVYFSTASQFLQKLDCHWTTIPLYTEYQNKYHCTLQRFSWAYKFPNFISCSKPGNYVEFSKMHLLTWVETA